MGVVQSLESEMHLGMNLFNHLSGILRRFFS